MQQRKTGRPVRFELTEQTRQAVNHYTKAAGKKPGEFLSVDVVVITALARSAAVTQRPFGARLNADVEGWSPFEAGLTLADQNRRSASAIPEEIYDGAVKKQYKESAKLSKRWPQP